MFLFNSKHDTKVVDMENEVFKEATSKTVEYTRMYMTKNRLIITQGYHGIFRKLAYYILVLGNLEGSKCEHL